MVLERLDGAAAQEWRKSWLVVLSAMMGMAISTSYIYSIGISCSTGSTAIWWRAVA